MAFAVVAAGVRRVEFAELSVADLTGAHPVGLAEFYELDLFSAAKVDGFVFKPGRRHCRFYDGRFGLWRHFEFDGSFVIFQSGWDDSRVDLRSAVKFG